VRGEFVSAPDTAKVPADAPYLQTGFLERLAHELRGPVGVTSGALDEIELALDADADAEEVRTYFLMARRGMRRVLRLAERLQRTAQLEGANVEWAMTPIDLRAVAEQAAKESELLEARRGVRVSVSCSDEPCPVAVDSTWMQFAIGDLVGNAIRFARSAVSVRCAGSAHEVTVTITDDGPGFHGPPRQRFEPPCEGRGVGLTLPLVRDVVASHGGRLELDGAREPGANASSGAIVVLTLPRSTKSER
jgi:signal transduction histidine kinase